jgi:hypothetical protein
MMNTEDRFSGRLSSLATSKFFTESYCIEVKLSSELEGSIELEICEARLEYLETRLTTFFWLIMISSFCFLVMLRSKAFGGWTLAMIV